jgi:hypothetical protein
MKVPPVTVQQTPQPPADTKSTNIASDNVKAAVENPKAAPKVQPADTVQISSAAKQALQEATETAAQTAKEAQSGDLQAQKLLAKEAAAQAAQQPPANTESKGAENLLK